jgi:hypothetical protein
MKTLPLRELLRQPSRVKRLTAAGHEVRVTDRGRPLWVIHADKGTVVGKSPQDNDEEEAFWQELLEAPKSGLPSFHEVLVDSRR